MLNSLGFRVSENPTVSCLLSLTQPSASYQTQLSTEHEVKQGSLHSPQELQLIYSGNSSTFLRTVAARAFSPFLKRVQKPKHAQDKTTLNSNSWGSKDPSTLFSLVYIIVKNILKWWVSQFQGLSFHPQLLLHLPLFNHSFMLPQPLAHVYSLLTAQLHICIQNYSNGFCDSAIERLREAVGRAGSERLYKMDCCRFTSHTHVMFQHSS